MSAGSVSNTHTAQHTALRKRDFSLARQWTLTAGPGVEEVVFRAAVPLPAVLLGVVVLGVLAG